MSRGTHARDARMGRFALAASGSVRAKEDEWMDGEVLDRHLHEVAGVAETCVCIPDLSLPLEAAGAKPLTRELETCAAVIGLWNHHSARDSVRFDDARMRNRVRHPSDRFGEVQHRILAVGDTEQQDLGAQAMHSPDWAVGSVRRRERLGLGYAARRRAAGPARAAGRAAAPAAGAA